MPKTRLSTEHTGRMRATSHRVVALFVASLCSGTGIVALAAQSVDLPFSCSTFPPDVGETDLKIRFGALNVTTGPVPFGGAEGDLNEGTILFASTPGARLEIFWKDRERKRAPDWVSVRTKRSRWRTPGGITPGTDLKTIERLNGRPFRLLGFGTDVDGTVMSWSGGRLESQDTSVCRVRIRLSPLSQTTRDGAHPAWRRLIGEREFSSGHPDMQTLDPVVYELVLQYAR